ncbi:uncharacterized protein LOC141613634 [Silene latifolia]|uniref:uncharacterized protein LOC141613634 n=1 Tax=Silene latifolia TaxID=37657 RepID=UPI003D777ECC
MANSCGKTKDFFGVIHRIYTIFANSNKRWEILKNNVTKYTLKQFSSTRWESHVDSVKAIRFQIAEVSDALLQVGETDNDGKIRSEAKSLAMNELGDFEFLVALVIWEIAIELDVDPIFPKKRVSRRKKHFDENQNDTSERFEQYEEYQNVFGFLFSSSKLNSLDNAKLKSCCDNLQIALTSGEQCDIDGNELFMELKLLKDLLPDEEMEPIDILKFLKRKSYFLNVFVVYRILLTILVTVASAERSFSKLKLLKSYMRSTMLQERLNGLATIAIEDDFLEKVDYDCLIEEFASRKTTRKSRFSNNL